MNAVVASAIVLMQLASGETRLQGPEIAAELLGTRIEGNNVGNDQRWRECIDPTGRTYLEQEEEKLRGRFHVDGDDACFDYKDEASPYCWEVWRSGDRLLLRWQDAGGSTEVYTVDRIEGNIRNCVRSWFGS